MGEFYNGLIHCSGKGVGTSKCANPTYSRRHFEYVVVVFITSIHVVVVVVYVV